MKIRQGDRVIDAEHNENLLKYEDLVVGDVFRYANGKEENIYIKGAMTCFHFNSHREFSDSPHDVNPPVVLYPNASMDLGEEQVEVNKDQELRRGRPRPSGLDDDYDLDPDEFSDWDTPW